jgi:ABC-type multidrug transport system fused ATPase/permease subunit
MKEQLKYFAKLSSIALFSLAKINIMGAVSTILTFIVGFILLSKSVETGHAGFIAGLGTMFTVKPVGMILLALILLSPMLYFFLGNKYVTQKIINQLVQDKSENIIDPIIDKILFKFKAKQPETLKKGADYALLKLKLINQIKEESDNTWLKRIILYGMEKVQLSDVDFSDDDVDFSSIIKQKTVVALENITEPSRRNIWILLILQVVFVLIIAFS